MMLLTHLWQSTVCAGLAAAVAASLPDASARVRHNIWLLASVKFLVPFSLLSEQTAAQARAALGDDEYERAYASRAESVDEALAIVLDEDAAASKLDQLSVRRWGNPGDVANLCLFLASDLSEYVSGALLDVSGGKFATQDPGAAWRSAPAPGVTAAMMRVRADGVNWRAKRGRTLSRWRTVEPAKRE